MLRVFLRRIQQALRLIGIRKEMQNLKNLLAVIVRILIFLETTLPVEKF